MLTPIAPPNHWPTRVTSSTSVTLGAGDATVLCNNTSDATVALPAAATVPGDIFAVKKIGSNTATVTIAPNGSETIDGATSYVLYVVGDYVVVQSDGASWRVVGGYLIPHKCQIARAAAQSITSFTQTKLLHDTIVFDNAALADIVNSRVVIRRDGVYALHATTTLIASENIIRLLNSEIEVNGTLVVVSGEAQNAGPYDLSAASYLVTSLAAGDVVQSRMAFASSASPLNTNSTTSIPRLTVEERR